MLSKCPNNPKKRSVWLKAAGDLRSPQVIHSTSVEELREHLQRFQRLLESCSAPTTWPPEARNQRFRGGCLFWGDEKKVFNKEPMGLVVFSKGWLVGCLTWNKPFRGVSFVFQKAIVSGSVFLFVYKNCRE